MRGRGVLLLIVFVMLCSFPTACSKFKQAGRSIKHTTKDVTRDIGHGTRDVVKGIGTGTKKAVKSVTE